MKSVRWQDGLMSEVPLNAELWQAAKFHKEAAELYEAELNPEKALFHFQVNPV